ncbi:hypothetical protein GF312_08560 [Candidatus Poribacteria bacterium]|nr:hypothetical protein [Candidatus Poribacteria bacterium]
MNKNSSIIILSFIIISILNLSTLAEDEYKYAGEFLNVGAGARALGMGGAFVAVADDGTTGYWSPGGLPALEYREVSFMHCQQFDSLVRTNFISYVHPKSPLGAFGISWLRLGVEDIPRTGYVDSNKNMIQDFDDKNDNGIKDPGEYYIEKPYIADYFDDIEDGIFLSYGLNVVEGLSMGLNFKIIRQSLGQHSSSGWGLDLGALYELYKGFRFGINFQDLPKTRIRWGITEHEEEIPASVKFGAAYTADITSLKSVVTLAWNVDTKYDTTMHYGLEWWLVDILALRAGLDEGQLSVGTGLRMSSFQVDYAFVGHDDLGSTHRVSTSVRF